MPVLEVLCSGPINVVAMKIVQVVENNALYQKTLKLLGNLDMAGKNTLKMTLVHL